MSQTSTIHDRPMHRRSVARDGSRLFDSKKAARPKTGVTSRARDTWGYTGNSLRVADFDAMREKVQGSGATAVTDAVPDEFGRRAFSFNAPDGNFWTAVEA